ncbi:EF-hand domain-containing protein [Bradyrhizobium arachidis]|uniref:EF-hand domain-containing protein n=1 Tax=Bradyrhizobium arachidis TaxID=858423 RepID=UPI0021636086|nr:EF-hand domain-containing protein [Bradyrhizobium arachidis]UVO27377.1 EF-hand domain-containing protein [Bradyrhizobium arachidis]
MHRGRRLTRTIVGTVALVFAVSVPAWSQQPSAAPPPLSQADQTLLPQIYAGMDLNRYLDQLRNQFVQLDADGDGKLTQQDADLHALMEKIQMRTVSLTGVLRYDLDGDGAVTEDEARRGAKYDMRGQLALSRLNASGLGIEEQIERLVRSVMALDADKDGKVTIAEASYTSRPDVTRAFAGAGLSGRASDAVKLAPSGELSLADYQAEGEALFRKIDSDNDGKVSQQELADYRRKPEPPDAKVRSDAAAAAQKRLAEQAEIARKKQEALDAERAACALPKASDTAKVVLLSAYQTDALSSVTIGSQDNEVHAGRVEIEPGSEPLYVVIASYGPTIWQFSGAVERVERLVMTSSRTGPNSGDARQPSLVGATGIPRDRITFFSRSNCLSYFSEAPSSASLQASGVVNNATGKRPDVVATKYSVASFSIPSGKIASVGDQRQPLIIQKSQGTLNIIGNLSNVIVQAGPSRARDEMERFYPGGVIEIDPNAVVASAPVAAYEVLPSQAGLVQLLAKGLLTQNRSGEYIVRQKIRFPAGLAGAHSATFLVMRGAPYPDGDPGHSCVVLEETGERKGGGACR